MIYKITGSVFFVLLAVVFQLTIIQKADTSALYPYKMKIYYSRIDGLREGTDVSILGVESGQIQEIRKVPLSEVPDKRYLDPTIPDAIEVTIILAKPITLWDNYNIRFKARTVFSGRGIEIDPGYPENETTSFFHPTYTENTVEPAFSPTARYFDDFFLGANALLKENQTDVRRTVVNLRSISEKLKGEKGTIPALINSDTMYNGLYDTTSDAKILLQEFRRYQEGIRETDTIFIPFTINMYRNSIRHLEKWNQ